MPNQDSVTAYKRFMESGICACGEHYDRHVDNLDDLKRSDTIRCKLLKSQVHAWNTIAQAPA